MLAAVVCRAIDDNTLRQTGCRFNNGVRIITQFDLKVHKRTGYVLYELDFLQHRLGVRTAAEVDIVLLGGEFDDLRSILGLLTGGSILGRTLCRGDTVPVPYLDVGSVATATGTEAEFQFSGYSRLGKAAIARAVEFDTLQAVVGACGIVDLVVEVQAVVRTTTGGALRVVP